MLVIQQFYILEHPLELVLPLIRFLDRHFNHLITNYNFHYFLVTHHIYVFVKDIILYLNLVIRIGQELGINILSFPVTLSHLFEFLDLFQLAVTHIERLILAQIILYRQIIQPFYFVLIIFILDLFIQLKLTVKKLLKLIEVVYFEVFHI